MSWTAMTCFVAFLLKRGQFLVSNLLIFFLLFIYSFFGMFDDDSSIVIPSEKFSK